MLFVCWRTRATIDLVRVDIKRMSFSTVVIRKSTLNRLLGNIRDPADGNKQLPNRERGMWSQPRVVNRDIRFVVSVGRNGG